MEKSRRGSGAWCPRDEGNTRTCLTGVLRVLTSSVRNTAAMQHPHPQRSAIPSADRGSWAFLCPEPPAVLGEQNPLPAAATGRLDGGITVLTRLKSRSVVNRISKPCRHRYLGFKVTRNSFWASDKPPYQNASTGELWGQKRPSRPQRW